MRGVSGVQWFDDALVDCLNICPPTKL